MSTGSMLYMLTYFPPIQYTRKGAFEQAEGTEVYGGYIQGAPGQPGDVGSPTHYAPASATAVLPSGGSIRFDQGGKNTLPKWKKDLLDYLINRLRTQGDIWIDPHESGVAINGATVVLNIYKNAYWPHRTYAQLNAMVRDTLEPIARSLHWTVESDNHQGLKSGVWLSFPRQLTGTHFSAAHVSGPPENSTLFGTPAQNHLGATPAIVEKFLGPCGINTGDYNLHFRREAADSKAHQPVNDKTIIRVIGNNNWLVWRGPLYVLRQMSVPLIFWQGHWWQFKTPPTPFAVPDAVFQRFLDISGDTQTFSNEPVGVMLPCAGFVKPGTLSAW